MKYCSSIIQQLTWEKKRQEKKHFQSTCFDMCKASTKSTVLLLKIEVIKQPSQYQSCCWSDSVNCSFSSCQFSGVLCVCSQWISGVLVSESWVICLGLYIFIIPGASLFYFNFCILLKLLVITIVECRSSQKAGRRT